MSNVPHDRPANHPVLAAGQVSPACDAIRVLIEDLQRLAWAYPEEVFPADSLSMDAVAGTALRRVAVPMFDRAICALHWALEEIDLLRNDSHVGDRLLDLMMAEDQGDR